VLDALATSAGTLGLGAEEIRRTQDSATRRVLSLLRAQTRAQAGTAA
jgi:hypothetical protein